jgi:hypothetical protein
VVVVRSGTVRSGTLTGDPSENVGGALSSSMAIVVEKRVPDAGGDSSSVGSSMPAESVSGGSVPTVRGSVEGTDGAVVATVGATVVVRATLPVERVAPGDLGSVVGAPVVARGVDVVNGTVVVVDVVVVVVVVVRRSRLEADSGRVDSTGTVSVLLTVFVGRVEVSPGIGEDVVELEAVDVVASVGPGGTTAAVLGGAELSTGRNVPGTVPVAAVDVVAADVLGGTVGAAVVVASVTGATVGGAVTTKRCSPEALKPSAPTTVHRRVYRPAGNSGTSRYASVSVAPRWARSVVMTSVPRVRLVPNRLIGSANWNTMRKARVSNVAPSARVVSTRTGVAAETVGVETKNKDPTIVATDASRTASAMTEWRKDLAPADVDIPTFNRDERSFLVIDSTVLSRSAVTRGKRPRLSRSAQFGARVPGAELVCRSTAIPYTATLCPPES